uniref:Uncharacterized protein n=1 Tax=viral metagenome TaxID=1070528 RepID=A0A6C0JVK9_9ZZZZ
MHSLLFTFAVGLLAITCAAFALLYKQDQYPTLKWYQVLGQDLPIRITFGILAILFAGYAGFYQFMMV